MPRFPSLPQSVLLVSLALSSSLVAQDPPKPDAPKTDSPATIAQKTAAMKRIDGFVPLDWDAKAGKLYLEIPRFNAEGKTPDLLYVVSLPYGTGSNDLGLDRGQLSKGVVVRFERIGPKVLLVQTNQRFRSGSSDADEQLAVTQSFPESVLWGFKVEAESAGGATVLVDATDFFLHDAHHVSETIAFAQQGAGHGDSYRLDASRSTIVPDDTKAFPKNSVVEAELTFTADGPLQGQYVRDVAPDPHSVTVRERQMFVELPPLDGSFKPRKFNPRSGYIDLSFRDYTAPLSGSLDHHWILRHRLIKKDPSCVTSCEAVEPIQYYVDRGAPEPIRSALREGASWWDEAFQAAGWAKGTFRVDLLPEGADPMDLRYNIIQWVHRYTRGWSYGDAIADPRTGEILKGNVTLGSLRGRQDYLIAEALLSPYAADKTYTDENNPMLQMVLARIRQLGAHETGHTLGLAHNFAASSVMQGDSVMDYPHPNITLDANGKIDLSHAYANGIGDWDKVSIDYGYRQFAPGTDEDAALSQILSEADKAGQLYITDEDARPAGGAHPKAHLWDNGPDAADELERILNVRAVALDQFGENAIKPGTPMAQLEETLVPLYLLHRYQAEATIKLIGGLDYRYNLRGDGQPNPAIVAPEEQQKAIAAVMKTLEPQTLTLPESLLAILPPHPPADPRTQESFPSHTGLTFDPVAAAESAADITLDVLLNPARASRLVEYHMREPKAPSLRSVLETISKTTAERTEGGHTMSSEVARAVEFRGLEAMLALALNPAASSQARAIVEWHIQDLLKQWTSAPAPTDTAEAIHRQAMIERIQQFVREPEKFVPAKPVEAPPGMPIGDDEEM
jgi:hypothetical protein